jgi:hypothetical protein
MKKQVNELSLERAIALLGNKKINKEKLTKMLERIKSFCKVAYQLYNKNIKPDQPNNAKQFEAQPPDEFTNAA